MLLIPVVLVPQGPFELGGMSSAHPTNQRFEVVIRSESKLASWESALLGRAGRRT